MSLMRSLLFAVAALTVCLAAPTLLEDAHEYPEGFEWLAPKDDAVCGSIAGLKAEDFLIEKLPLLQERISFKQYSGYLPAIDGIELFFWYVEAAETKPEDSPLLVWFNGGPGASSVAYGFWTEHGPFRLAENGTRVLPYEYSWNRKANVVYIEAPTGVGYSFAKNSTLYSTNTDESTAESNFCAVQNFVKLFNVEKLPLYITGESYGGHYVPTLSALTLTRPNTLNMKGFFIGNPGIESDWYYNVNEYAFLTFLWSNALIPQDAYIQAFNACGWSEFLTDCDNYFDKPNKACQDAAKKAWKYVPKVWDPYNALAGTCHQKNVAADSMVASYTPWLHQARLRAEANVTYDPCINNETPLYMNRKDVIKALHAEKHYNREWPSTPANWNYGDETAHIDKLFPLFASKAPQWNVMVVSGTADAAVPFVGTQRWIECLKRPVVADWEDWMLNGDVAGTIKKYKGISLLTVKGCGHTIPTYCPEAGYAMLEKYLAH